MEEARNGGISVGLPRVRAVRSVNKRPVYNGMATAPEGGDLPHALSISMPSTSFDQILIYIIFFCSM